MAEGLAWLLEMSLVATTGLDLEEVLDVGSAKMSEWTSD